MLCDYSEMMPTTNAALSPPGGSKRYMNVLIMLTQTHAQFKSAFHAGHTFTTTPGEGRVGAAQILNINCKAVFSGRFQVCLN